MERRNTVVIAVAVLAIVGAVWLCIDAFHVQGVAVPEFEQPTTPPRPTTTAEPGRSAPFSSSALLARERAPQPPVVARNVARCEQVNGTLSCGACMTDKDCPEGQGCTLDPTTRRTVCISSNCRTDSDCGPGKRCLPLRFAEDGATATRCYGIGTKKEDELCNGMHEDTASECAEGLVCTAGECRPACRSTSDCAEGSECWFSPAGASCVRTSCENVTCPSGEHCARGRCHSGIDCSDPKACPAGYRCSIDGIGHRWTGSCFKPCRDDETCGPGALCIEGGCQQQCDANQSGCPEGTVCSSGDPSSGRFGCRPL